MSARRSKNARLERKNAPRCRMCKSKDLAIKVYEDGFDLHVCKACGFPERKKRDG